MGEYMFKKGEKADYAYVILFGTVLLLSVKTESYLPGQEPSTPTNKITRGKRKEKQIS